MGYCIEGWVEVTRYQGVAQEEECAWSAFVNISTVIDVGDTVSEKLFGLSRRYSTGEFSVESLAVERGIPPFPSPEVAREIEAILEAEKEHGGPCGCGGYTHAKWGEMKTVSFIGQELERSDWSLLFDIAKRLEQDYRFTDDQIRFVVWFNW